MLSTSPRSLRVLHSSFSSLLTGCLFPALDIAVHTTTSWQHTHSLDWTGTDRLHQPTLFTTTQADTPRQLALRQDLFTHASQPWNNDSHCRYHSLHCALSLSHVWRARKNAIVYCYCSAIVSHKADIPLAQYSHGLFARTFCFPDTRFAIATFTNRLCQAHKTTHEHHDLRSTRDTAHEPLFASSSRQRSRHRTRKSSCIPHALCSNSRRPPTSCRSRCTPPTNMHNYTTTLALRLRHMPISCLETPTHILCPRRALAISANS